MKKYYTQLWILFFVVFSFPTLSAQNGNKISNNGLQLGVLVDGNFAQRMAVNQNNGGMNEPLTQPAMGWKSGIELSYNFLDYFGVSVGVTYGTDMQIKFDPLYNMTSPDNIHFHEPVSRHMYGLQIPIKLSVNVPFNDKWSFYAAAGVNLRNITSAIGYSHIQKTKPSEAWIYYRRNSLMEHMPFSSYGRLVYEHDIREKSPMKVKADLILNMGFTYRLPYSDLIRLSMTTNISFTDDLTGEYNFVGTTTSGSYHYRHNLLGLEIAYIHCFPYWKRK